jgi:hypothetical protein
MNILRSIQNAYDTASRKGWDKIYWAIDLHGTISKPTYSSDNLKPDYYPYAKEVLKMLSDDKNTVLIFYTCSYPDEIEKVREHMKDDGIVWDYVWDNPEASDTGYGYYRKKPYFNLILEDKGGFEPEKDWKDIYEYLSKNLGKLSELLN